MTNEHIAEDDSHEFTELPGRVRAELIRLRAEREIFDDEQERLKGQLVEAEEEIRSLQTAQAERAHLEQRVAHSTEQARQSDEDRRTATARAEALGADLTRIRQERDASRAELAACRTERDELRLRLLDAAAAPATGDVATADNTADHDSERIAAEERALEIAQELDATRRTLSWRVTAPLRAIRGFRRRD